MTTYGDVPGVKIVEQAGDFSTVEIGRNQYLTLVGFGTDNATEEENTLIEYIEHSELSSVGGDTLDLQTVGENGSLAELIQDASDNGVETRYLRAVMVGTEEKQKILSQPSGSLSADYVVPSVDSITAINETTSDELAVKLRYESPPDAPGENEMYLNPHSGEYEIDTDIESVDLTYEEAYWDDALRTAVNAHSEGEFGIVAAATTDEQAASQLATAAETVRTNRYGMVLGAAGAEPNATMNDTYPMLNPVDYEHGLDNDELFLFGPTLTEGEEPTSRNFGAGLLGTLAGKLASRATSDPLYTDTLDGNRELVQSLSRGEVDVLREQYIIPVKDDGGRLTLEDNQSTEEWEAGVDWEKDLFRRQVVDLVIATAYQIGRNQIGTILDQGTVTDTQETLVAQMSDFVDQGLLRAGGQTVSVQRDGPSTLDVGLVITPLGVTKSVEVSLTIQR